MDIGKLVVEFGALAGVGGFVAFLVNVLKTASVVKDGDAPVWVTGFNLLGLIVLFGLKVFAPTVDILKLDGFAATLAQIGVLVLGLVTQLAGSKLGHAVVRGTPLIGKSYSLKRG